MSGQARNIRIDALRIVSMLFIIILHVLNQGGLLDGCIQYSGDYYYLSFLNIISYCAVNVYGLITGYVLCIRPFKLSRLINLWVITFFWSCVISVIFLLLGESPGSRLSLLLSFMPFLSGNYWFFTAYFVVYLCSPILNYLLKSFNAQKIRFAIHIALLIFCVIPIASLGNNSMQISKGYHFVWMIVLYMIGGYFRLYRQSIRSALLLPNKCWYLLACLFFALLQLLYKFSVEYITLRFLGEAKFGDLFLSYNSPLVLGEAICLFLCAIPNTSIVSWQKGLCSLIRWITPGVFSVYIIHTHPLIWEYVLKNRFLEFSTMNVFLVTGLILMVSISVFVSCIMLDTIRQKVFKLLKVDGLIENLSHDVELRHYYKG